MFNVNIILMGVMNWLVIDDSTLLSIVITLRILEQIIAAALFNVLEFKPAGRSNNLVVFRSSIALQISGLLYLHN